METGIVIIAAGNSSRLGRPKQLLEYRGKTLLQHIIDEADLANLNPIVLVLGANSDKITENVRNVDHIVINESWENGMASSIAAGITELLNMENIPQNVIISVCDQPLLTAEVFLNLVKEKNSSSKNIVASIYAETIGVPALFGEKYYDYLLRLSGKEGAKKIINEFEADLSTISFENGRIDIDTEKDFVNLQYTL